MFRAVTTAHALSLFAGLALPTLAAAGPLRVIFSKKPGHATAVLPGAVDLSGNPEATEWKAIEDVAVSPDGSRWILKSRSTVTEDHNSGIVMGAGTSGTLFILNTASEPFHIQEGRPAPFGASADWVDFVASAFGRFDDNGNLVFGLRARTTQTGGTAAADAMRAIKWNGATGTLAFKQGDLYTGLQDIPANPSGDETVGNSANSFHLLNDGRVGSSDLTIGSISTTRRPAIFYDRAMFHQVNVTSVTGFGGAGTAMWTGMDSNGFYTTPSGQHWWMTGAYSNGATQTIFAYDGQVRLESGQAIPGSATIVGDIFQVSMASNGDYIARGRDNSGTTAAAPDWAFRNGALAAKTGDPVTPGSAEHWGDTFYAVAANRSGDYLIIGNTDNASAGADNVVVLNGTQVVLREGDPVDLDGNGVFDDDAFIGRGVNTNPAFGVNVINGATNWWLLDDRTLYGIVMLRDLAGNDLNTVPAFGTPQAFVRISLGGPECYANCDGSTTPPVLNVADFGCFLNRFAAGESYANCDGGTTPPVLNVADFGCFLNAFAAGCS